jgi:hypothetical protein
MLADRVARTPTIALTRCPFVRLSFTTNAVVGTHGPHAGVLRGLLTIDRGIADSARVAGGVAAFGEVAGRRIARCRPRKHAGVVVLADLAVIAVAVYHALSAPLRCTDARGAVLRIEAGAGGVAGLELRSDTLSITDRAHRCRGAHVSRAGAGYTRHGAGCSGAGRE